MAADNGASHTLQENKVQAVIDAYNRALIGMPQAWRAFKLYYHKSAATEYKRIHEFLSIRVINVVCIHRYMLKQYRFYFSSRARLNIEHTFEKRNLRI